MSFPETVDEILDVSEDEGRLSGKTLYVLDYFVFSPDLLFW